jgi:hypothetical protein
VGIAALGILLIFKGAGAKAAAEAGEEESVGLFRGLWRKVFGAPKVELTSEERAVVDIYKDMGVEEAERYRASWNEQLTEADRAIGGGWWGAGVDGAKKALKDFAVPRGFSQSALEIYKRMYAFQAAIGIETDASILRLRLGKKEGRVGLE